jgi:Mg2+/Co2+ transporter CorB
MEIEETIKSVEQSNNSKIPVFKPSKDNVITLRHLRNAYVPSAIQERIELKYPE